MLSAFKQDRDHNVGIASRSQPYEPAVLLKLVPFGTERFPFCQAHQLRATGLSCEVDSLEVSAGSRATRIHHFSHRVGNGEPILLADIHPLYLLVTLGYFQILRRKVVGKSYVRLN